MTLQVAVDYDAGWYSTSGPRLMGANAASEGFLRALVQYGDLTKIGGYVGKKESLEAFTRRVGEWNSTLPTSVIAHPALPELANFDVLYRGDPVLSERAWQRRTFNSAGWSLCGVTHTTCSLGALDGFRDIVTAPFEPWDAVVCTSQAVRTTVLQVLESYGQYLHSLGGGSFQPKLELPVIPLGVDYDTLATDGNNPLYRRTHRAALGIANDDLVFLFLGRLVYHAKAHPLPMFLALRQAAEATGKTLHLIMAGWFGSPEIEKVFRASVGICPQVKVHFVDGRRPEIRQQIWAAADVFISLVDNIQETFGLTPLEAMSARLPVIVSDWDGYRENVRHEIDGLLIPTYAPPFGGQELLLMHHLGNLTFDEYGGSVCQSSAVDVAAVTAACIRLIKHPELRQQMGMAGQERARQHFAWQHIIKRYVELWEELKRRRLAAGGTSTAAHPMPWLQDPFVAFGHYPTLQLGPQTKLQLTTDGLRTLQDPRVLEAIYQHRLLRFVTARGLLFEPEDAQRILHTFSAGPALIQAALADASGDRLKRTWRTIGWLLKINLLSVVDRPAPRPSP